MKKIISIVFLFIGSFSCTTVSENSLNVDDFDSMLQQSKDVQLIDIRSPQEFKNYCIPGAQNIDFNHANFRTVIDALDKTKPVLVYCLSGKRSKLAMKMLQKSGFTAVYELNSGINAWAQAGKPIDMG